MNRNYAVLPDRVKAAIIDSLLLIGFMYAASELLALFEAVPTYVRIIVAVFIFLLYDPIFTSYYGGTVGHSFSGIEVKREVDTDRNISFPAAVLRFIFKALLGWISLLTVTAHEKKRAIHDLVAGSVVLEELSEDETTSELSEDGSTLPDH